MSGRSFQSDLNLVLHMAKMLLEVGDKVMREAKERDPGDVMGEDAEEGRQEGIDALANVHAVLDDFMSHQNPKQTNERRDVGVEMDLANPKKMTDWEKEDEDENPSE